MKGNVDGVPVAYHSALYVNGTKCDLTGKPRMAVVRVSDRPLLETHFESSFLEVYRTMTATAGVHTGMGGGGADLGYPPQSYFPPPPPQEFSQPNYSRMFCACANYFRMAISTSRMPQNQFQSIYFSKLLGVF